MVRAFSLSMLALLAAGAAYAQPPPPPPPMPPSMAQAILSNPAMLQSLMSMGGQASVSVSQGPGGAQNGGTRIMLTDPAAIAALTQMMTQAPNGGGNGQQGPSQAQMQAIMMMAQSAAMANGQMTPEQMRQMQQMQQQMQGGGQGGRGDRGGQGFDGQGGGRGGRGGPGGQGGRGGPGGRGGDFQQGFPGQAPGQQAMMIPGPVAPVARPVESIGVTFQRSISAILDVNTSPRIMLIENQYGVDGLRMLKIGDEYRQGWKLSALTAQRATLTKGKNSVNIDIGRPLPAQPIAAVAPGGAAPMNINALMTTLGGAPGAPATPGPAPAPGRPANVQAAIRSGDAKSVVAMRGTPQQALQALQNNPAIASSAGFQTLNQALGQNNMRVFYFNSNGRTGLAAVGPQGYIRGTYVPPEGLGPPPLEAITAGAGAQGGPPPAPPLPR